MIKVNMGSVEVSGEKLTIMGELAVLIESMLTHGFDEEDIECCMKLAKMSDAEVRSAIVKNLQELQELFK